MVPLGGARRWGASGDQASGDDTQRSNGGSYDSLGSKREREDSYASTAVTQNDEGECTLSFLLRPFLSCLQLVAPRKRRSRWGEEKSSLGVITALGANVSEMEAEKYALNVRIEEINRKLRLGDIVPPERERSPSPPPTYDTQGRRTNTREVRYRKKLEEERVRLVDKQIKLDPNYRPPMEYAAAKRNMKPTEKVYLPIKEFPEINFFGLLVGPRGNSLKKMESESGAKISIRGKGSVKVGKGRMDDESEEEMHCVVTADDEAKVRKCIRLINLVIETAASTPEAQNDHKRNQLRELATLNGTLRDDENQVCQNCGSRGHRKYDCPEQRNWTAHIICHRCGQQGHLARDCASGGAGGSAPRPGNPGSSRPGGVGNGDPYSAEYENLMAELGEGGKGNTAGQSHAPVNVVHSDYAIGPDGKKIPPWRDPNVWHNFNLGHSGARGGQRYGGGYQQQYGSGYQQEWGGQEYGSGYNYNQQGAYDYSSYQGQYDMQGQQPSAQPDYREAWEAYYRSQGMDQAAAAAAAASAAGNQQSAQSNGGAQQADYSKEWEEYVASFAVFSVSD